MCDLHPGEQLKPCVVCGAQICGECETLVNPLTKNAIDRYTWTSYTTGIRLVGASWPAEPWVACLKCAKKGKFIE